MKIDYCIGIEGVGMRKSVAVLSTRQGKILSASRLMGEPISFHTTPRDLLKSRILSLLRSVLYKADLHLSDLSRCNVCIGLTGVTFKYDRVIDLPDLLKPLDLKIANPLFTGDAEIIFAAYAQKEHGSLVLSHSGSTGYVVDKKNGALQHFRYGGWGPAFGDEGSGYAIGRAALRAIGREYDSGLQPSLLWKEVQEWLTNPDTTISAWHDGSKHWELVLDSFHRSNIPGIDPRTLLFHFAHSVRQHGIAGTCLAEEGGEVWRKIAAGIAIPLFQAFSKGDKTVEAIIDQAVADLAYQHKEACKVAKLNGYTNLLPIVYAGGVLSYNTIMRDKLTNSLQKLIKTEFVPITNKNPKALRPVLGALLFALGESEQERLRLPNINVIETVRVESQQYKFREELYND